MQSKQYIYCWISTCESVHHSMALSKGFTDTGNELNNGKFSPLKLPQIKYLTSLPNSLQRSVFHSKLIEIQLNQWNQVISYTAAISEFLGCVNVCFILHCSGTLCQVQHMLKNTRLMPLQTWLSYQVRWQVCSASHLLFLLGTERVKMFTVIWKTPALLATFYQNANIYILKHSLLTLARTQLLWSILFIARISKLKKIVVHNSKLFECLGFTGYKWKGNITSPPRYLNSNNFQLFPQPQMLWKTIIIVASQLQLGRKKLKILHM